MALTRLDMPFTDGGIHATNFFNGRILSREDMQREQEHEKAVHERLGLAVGDGIVRGFEVEAKAIGGSSIADPVVTVHSGLAVNSLGQAIALDRDVDVALKKPIAPQTTGTVLAGSFGDCEPAADAVYVVGSGVYLLAVAPAQVKQGLALVSGLGNEGTSCNVKEIVEGVQFRLYQMSALSDAELLDEARLRNVAAYKFFFAEGVGMEAVRDPFGKAPAAQQLTETPVDECDVPLAILHWTVSDGLRWVDLWSVRRPVLRSDGVAVLLAHRKRRAAGSSMVRQLFEQLQSMRTPVALSARASDSFRWLPPVGLLPLGALGDQTAFDSATFFDGFTTRGPMFVEGARLPWLFGLGATFPPISVGDPELVWLYLVRENRQIPAGVSTPLPYLVFTLGRVPCQVAPRFDVSHWDYANYALEDELIGF
jgi:hypothetical protein